MDTFVFRLTIMKRDESISCIDDSEDNSRSGMAGVDAPLAVLVLILHSDHHARHELGGLLDDLCFLLSLGNCHFYKKRKTEIFAAVS